MPKKTFFNLPREKKQKILEAGLEELISVPLSEISINRIIQHAGISRGSFYQYFEDKQDLIGYITSDAVHFVKENFEISFDAAKGDPFAASKQILEDVFVAGEKDVYRRLMKNLLGESSNMEHGYCFLLQIQQDLLDIFKNKIDRTKLKLEDKDAYENLAKILFILLKEAAITYLYEGKDPQQYRKEFDLQLGMLKEGVLRKE